MTLIICDKCSKLCEALYIEASALHLSATKDKGEEKENKIKKLKQQK